jgi:hypothetical protein
MGAVQAAAHSCFSDSHLEKLYHITLQTIYGHTRAKLSMDGIVIWHAKRLVLLLSIRRGMGKALSFYLLLHSTNTEDI